MDNMKILDRLVSIKINANERTSAKLKEEPECNPYLTKAAYLENGIKQLIIEVQNLVFANQIKEHRNYEAEYQLLNEFAIAKNEAKNKANIKSKLMQRKIYI